VDKQPLSVSEDMAAEDVVASEEGGGIADAGDLLELGVDGAVGEEVNL
jgi:hypothetical protein